MEILLWELYIHVWLISAQTQIIKQAVIHVFGLLKLTMQLGLFGSIITNLCIIIFTSSDCGGLQQQIIYYLMPTLDYHTSYTYMNACCSYSCTSSPSAGNLETTFKLIISLFWVWTCKKTLDCNYADSSVGGRFSGGKYSLRLAT